MARGEGSRPTPATSRARPRCSIGCSRRTPSAASATLMAKVYFAWAKQLEDKKQWAEAAAAYSKAQGLDPKGPDATDGPRRPPLHARQGARGPGQGRRPGLPQGGRTSARTTPPRRPRPRETEAARRKPVWMLYTGDRRGAGCAGPVRRRDDATSRLTRAIVARDVTADRPRRPRRRRHHHAGAAGWSSTSIARGRRGPPDPRAERRPDRPADPRDADRRPRDPRTGDRRRARSACCSRPTASITCSARSSRSSRPARPWSAIAGTTRRSPIRAPAPTATGSRCSTRARASPTSRCSCRSAPRSPPRAGSPPAGPRSCSRTCDAATRSPPATRRRSSELPPRASGSRRSTASASRTRCSRGRALVGA